MVESVGSPRDGDQVARLRPAGGAGAGPRVERGLSAWRRRCRRSRRSARATPWRSEAASDRRRTTTATASTSGGPGRPGAWTRRPWPSWRHLPASRSSRCGTRRATRSALALPEPEAGLAAGILIGLRERVDRSLAADFATAGASHVVAISGWNIAIVGGSRRGGAARPAAARSSPIVVGGTILAYVVAAGASPSVVRAAVMAAVVLLARESGRAGRAPAALALAAFAMLLAEPAMIGDAGFRLSVAATAGLLAWGTPLGRWIGGLAGGRVPGWLAEGLGISLAAQAATLPDVLVTFGRLSLVAPAVNLAVVPLVPAAMGAGRPGDGRRRPGDARRSRAPSATILGLPGWLLLHVIVAVVRIAAGLPFAAVAIPPGGRRRRRRSWRRVAGPGDTRRSCAGSGATASAAGRRAPPPSGAGAERARRARRAGHPDPRLARRARLARRGGDRRRALDARPRPTPPAGRPAS